jgi:hypothetical protein
MLAMIDKGKPHEAQPAYWEPFVVVGPSFPTGVTIDLMLEKTQW